MEEINRIENRSAKKRNVINVPEVTYHSLKPNQLKEWFELCGTVFSIYGYNAAYFEAHYTNDSWKNMESIFVAEDDGVLVSSVRVFHRRIFCNGRIVSMAGIGEVCTLDSYREKGISSHLLSMAMEYIDNNGFEISLLVTGVHKHYETFGYKVQKSYSHELDFSMGVDSSYIKTELRVRKVEFNKKYIPLFSKLYDRYMSKYNGIIVRDNSTYWDKWFRYESNKEERYLSLIEKDDDIIGYIIFEVKDEKVIVHEYIGEDKEVFDFVLLQIGVEENVKVGIVTSIIDTFLPIIKEVSSDDWMYRDSVGANCVLQESGRKNQFNIWSTDSF